MKKEEKLEIAKNIYDNLGLTNYSLKIFRDEEINADFVCVPDMRGPGGLIIADDGEYLLCQSAHDYNYWKEEFKKGIRSNWSNIFLKKQLDTKIEIINKSIKFLYTSN